MKISRRCNARHTHHGQCDLAFGHPGSHQRVGFHDWPNVVHWHNPEARMTPAPTPVPVVAAIISDTRTMPFYLLGRRSPDAKSYPDHWNNVGGKVEKGEEPEEALVREVREELGITVRVYDKVCDLHRYTDTGIYVCVTYYRCLLPNSERAKIRTSPEIVEYRWMSLTGALELKLAPLESIALRLRHGGY